MEKSVNRNLRLGIFVTFSALIFSVAVYLIGQKQDMFSNTFQLKVIFNNVNGLQTGNNVRFSGINVGSVLGVDIINDSTIEVTLRIRENLRIHIKRNAVATIGTDGLMGNMLVNINPGRGEAPVVNDGDYLESFSRIKTDDILMTLNTTNENAAILTSDLVEIVQAIKHGQGTLSYLLYDTSMRLQVFQAVSNLKKATDQTNNILSQIAQISKDVDRGRGLAGWLINDTLTQDKLHVTLDELQTAARQVNGAADTLNQMIAQWSNGEGPVPALMTDTAMTNDLRKTLEHLNVGTAKFSEDMEAMQKHWLFRKYFKDKEKEADKKSNP